MGGTPWDGGPISLFRPTQGAVRIYDIPNKYSLVTIQGFFCGVDG